MFSYHIIFDKPVWLGLLALLPVLWWFSARSLSGLGPIRKWFAIGLRTTVLLLIITALAELRFAQDSERLTVIYLLDQSESIPESQRRLMLNYVRNEVQEHRNKLTKDRAGIIVFGQQAEIEIPPFDDSVVIQQLETRVDRDYTNIAAAFRMAQALFPEDAAKRIVLVSDGNENQGDVIEQGRLAAQAGVVMDVIAVRYPLRTDVAVEKVTLPPDVRKGQPFELRVVLNNTAPESAGESGAVTGKLTVTRTRGGTVDASQDHPVRLPPGKTVFTLKEEITEPAFYSYEARFTPDPGMNLLPRDKNKAATSFTYVQGAGRVLFIEDWERRGEHDHLLKTLRNAGNGDEAIEVTVRPSDRAFDSLAELQLYDCVILANVPRASGFDEVGPDGKIKGESIRGITDAQISMLVRNTQQMGCGLIMLGGENSFGAGGWANTELEAAMPVDFHIKAAKVEAVGALAMLMHASEMADGNHWQKVIAKEAVKALGPMDWCGVIQWVDTDRWLWTVDNSGLARVGTYRDQMLGKIDRMFPGDMPQFDGSLNAIAAEFSMLKDAAAKHVILISDGDPPLNSNAPLKALSAQGAKVTTVAIGAHGTIETVNMQTIATQTGGKFYAVTNANALPRIFQKEARRVARPLVYENPSGFSPSLASAGGHELLAGIDRQQKLPPITGYVLTHKKSNPLVEQILTAPLPAGADDNTILAAWNYGIGRTVAFTTDAGRRWANQWSSWASYDKFFAQMVRWAMRPAGDQGKFTVATDVRDGKTRVTVTALDKNDEFVNFLNLSGSVVSPGLDSLPLQLQQTAPGRYVGEFDSAASGSYFVSLTAGTGAKGQRSAPLIAGVNVPYSSEFLDRETNDSLLKTLTGLTPPNSPAGQQIGDLQDEKSLATLVQTNTFRHDLPHVFRADDAWHYLLLTAACLFWGDVFIRRVMVHFYWLPVLIGRLRDKLLGRPEPVKNDYLERLRSRKAEVAAEVQQQVASTRFEPDPATATDLDIVDQELQNIKLPPQQRRPTGSADTVAPDAAEGEDYTSRLLKAKRKAQGEPREGEQP